MSKMAKALIIIALLLFGFIGYKLYLKKEREPAPSFPLHNSQIYGKAGERVELSLPSSLQLVAEKEEKEKIASPRPPPVSERKNSVEPLPPPPDIQNDTPLPEADLIGRLFTFGNNKLPIVETIVYKSRVPWQKGRPAWLSDYAAHYATSRHFIARSLNGKPDYLKQEVKEGDRFNVLKLDMPLAFHLVVDLSRCKLWFFYHDLSTDERVLLKSYPVGVGRITTETTSGFLTPLGCYRLGDKVGVYKPKLMGLHNGQKIEMMRTFGTRWIPFAEEVSDCTASAKGFGIHGMPWIEQPATGLKEELSSLGKHESDGCIRLATADMEELFAIIITKPTTVEIVKNFWEAKLPGVEVSSL